VDLVVIDLRALEFMDSSGVHLLLTADRRLRWTGARLVVVVRFGSDVEWLLALTGADRRLELSDYLPDLEARRRTSPAQPRREKMG
jgi:anti-anti-sigma factor